MKERKKERGWEGERKTSVTYFLSYVESILRKA
jgi:hypothetical protein